ncbi:GNAT family N-acetyltransferase [Phyllobacterium myrsinacearum]|uniref:Putative N-acetyltransferase YhbS n=1 Tax=Phyllobacterium myrsinacearum TaxID=28101 RepID=A0A839EPH4_9HYPH|nr:GNAT family N-acetyltransferase [Phyllobacterium myrsinacearum]MBA8880128.1 putative N-acetyltransferase YhbS [Phyllobacterium myrsinacearum]
MDLLVRLYALEPKLELDRRLADAGIVVRRVLAPEFALVVDWIKQEFGPGWASETTAAFARQPPSCFIAAKDGKPVGFACYDAIARGYFGPTGVSEVARGAGIGHGLLLACLLDMRTQGYGYAVIGDVGPVDFYVRAVGATPITDSTPGIVAGLLRYPD